MKYQNPIVKGFYPDPSVCYAEGKFYMVNSTFQYFPGVPLLESNDLVNWTQIGNVLTRKSQVELEKINSSGGVFAPTIRYHEGRFYMVTTNDTTHRNFYVYTDDIHGEWSEPITIAQDGIDPSLLFDNGHVYFISNGTDDNGEGGVVQCEINITTGEKLSPSKCIWKGSGGRYLESPHMYNINGSYYLMAAEGGTEYGHMITYARSASVWGPFQNYAHNPVLTNRNKAPFIIQGIGHGDLIQDQQGGWHILSLGFRQIHMWMTYHHLGREVFLTPVQFDSEGWFTAGKDGTTDAEYELPGDFTQLENKHITFENTDPAIDWIYLRHPHSGNYELTDNCYTLHGTEITLDEADSPTFIGIRQRDFDMELSVRMALNDGEGGVTVYMNEHEHYEIALRKKDAALEALLKLNVGNIRHIQNQITLAASTDAKVDAAAAPAALAADASAPAAGFCEFVTLIIRSDSQNYQFYVKDGEQEILLGNGESKYLSSEVAGGFTGVVLGLYAVGKNTACFENLDIRYIDQ